MSEGLVKFVLVGPNAGKTVGFSQDHTGKARYQFVNGVMEVHPTRVNGRLIKFLKKTYSAVLESEVEVDEEENDGEREPAKEGDDSVGGASVSSDLKTEEPHPAAGAAIELKGDDDPDAGDEEQPAKGRRGRRAKASG